MVLGHRADICHDFGLICLCTEDVLRAQACKTFFWKLWSHIDSRIPWTPAQFFTQLLADEVGYIYIYRCIYGVGRKRCVRRPYRIWFGHAPTPISFSGLLGRAPEHMLMGLAHEHYADGQAHKHMLMGLAREHVLTGQAHEQVLMGLAHEHTLMGLAPGAYSGVTKVLSIGLETGTISPNPSSDS